MKKIKFFAPILICFIVLGSCKKNFLDKPPGVDLTEESVFKTRVALDQFIATTYRYSMHSVFRYGVQGTIPFSGVNNTDCIQPSTTISDEGDASDANFVNNNRWNEGVIQPATIVNHEDFRYFIRWIAMRQINLILKRINEVPDADAAYKKQVIAEVKFLRSMNYFEMLKRYGGMPIITQIFEPGVTINAPRNTFEECVNFALKDVNEALPDLPASHPAALAGRTTAMAAHALKAKILLFAASPQYNTANPIISMPNSSENKLICYGNFDANRWKLAIDAFKAALDYAAANGYSIIDIPANRNPNELNNGTVGPLGNYRESWENPNNPEIILKYQHTREAGGITNIGSPPVTYINASCFGSFWSGMTMPLNFISKYENRVTGNAENWTGGGTDLIAKYNSLDPRFKQSVTYTNAYHTARDPIAQIFNGGKDYVNCRGGVWIRKSIPRSATNASFVLNDILFRVNELFLYYAEALNEFNTAPPIEAYSAVNVIRARSAMPNFPSGLSKDQFRQKLRNEIAIELLNEDHRFWDVKRWLIAEEEGVMKGSMTGLLINRVGTTPNFTFTWQPYVFETRTFNKNMYLHPLPLNEVLKGNLQQNPGW